MVLGSGDDGGPLCCGGSGCREFVTKPWWPASGKMLCVLIQSTDNNETKDEGIQQVKKLGEYVKIKWESKVLHGQYIGSVDRQLIGGEDTLLWLLRGDLKGETGSEIMAAQIKALQTNHLATKILQTETDSKCRL